MDKETARPCRSRAADEAAADVAREMLRAAGAVAIEPDPPLAVMLAPGERVLAVRHGTRVELVARTTEQVAGPADLYLTDRRLVIAAPALDVPLEDIREVGIVGNELLLLIDGRGGVRIHTEDPRVLRVELAAARTAVRASDEPAPKGQPASR